MTYFNVSPMAQVMAVKTIQTQRESMWYLNYQLALAVTFLDRVFVYYFYCILFKMNN